MPQPLLVARDLSRRFGSVVACDQVSLSIERGQIHALLGENGAGKSTLIAMLSGMVEPNHGELSVAGEHPISGFTSPAQALSAGIRTVFQRSGLASEFTVEENVSVVSGASAHTLAETLDITQRLLNHDRITAKTLLARLDSAEAVIVEIARALAMQPNVLVLDEPTALLPSDVAERLYQELARRAASGLGILLVTHRLGELLGVATAVTVMRAGRVTVQLSREQLATGAELEQQLLRAMFGDAQDDSPSDDADALQAPPRLSPPDDSEIAVELAEAYTGPYLPERQHNGQPPASSDDRAAVAGEVPDAELRGVSFAVRRGEVLALAGVAGNGQHTLASVLDGSRQLSHGWVRLGSRDVTQLSVRERFALGLRSVSDDRFGEALVPEQSLAWNLSIKHFGTRPLWRLGFAKRRLIRQRAVETISAASIRAQDPEVAVSTLSGGNAQKIIVARESDAHASVVVMRNPTQGLDHNTVRSVWQRIEQLCQSGVAVVLVSADLEEVAELADRVLVLASGRVRSTLLNDPSLTLAERRTMIARAIAHVDEAGE